MKKKYQELALIIFLLSFYLGIFFVPQIFMTTGVKALVVFKEKLFPSIFPFFVFSFLLLNMGFADKLSALLKKPMAAFFHIQGTGAFVLIMSIISGFPSGSKYIAKLYEEKKLTKKESNYLLLFTHFANPLFVLGTCGGLLLNSALAFKIFLCQLASNLLLGFFLRPRDKEKNTPFVKMSTDSSFLQALPDAINEAMQVLLFMLGSITFFMIVSQLFQLFCPLPPFYQVSLTGILDLTSGITAVKGLAIPPNLQALMMLSFITFGSLSVHLQVVNALRKTDLSYSRFFCGRLLQTSIALLLFVFF